MKAFEYRGYEVELDSKHKFFVKETDKAYDTADAAKEAIEAHQRYEVKVKAKKMSLEVIGSDGVRRVLTGVHANQNKFLTKPSFDRYNHPDLYPVVPWIERILEEKVKHQTAIKEIDQQLDGFELEEPRDWNGPYRGKTASERLDVLDKDYADKKRQAEVFTGQREAK